MTKEEINALASAIRDGLMDHEIAFDLLEEEIGIRFMWRHPPSLAESLGKGFDGVRSLVEANEPIEWDIHFHRHAWIETDMHHYWIIANRKLYTDDVKSPLRLISDNRVPYIIVNTDICTVPDCSLAHLATLLLNGKFATNAGGR